MLLAVLRLFKRTIKINKVFGVFTSLFRLDLILCLTSNFVCKNTANFPLRSSKHKKRWWCVLYLKKGRKKDFVLGKNLRRRLKRFFGLNFFKIYFFDFSDISVDCRGLKVLEKKVSENGPNSVVFLILMINTVYKFFLYPHSK